MKHLNFLSNLLSLSLGSPCTDVSLDCRLTVGSPSGLDAKWKQNPFMRFAVVLTLIFTIGSGNVWGAVLTGDYASSAPTGWSQSGSQKTGYYQLGATNDYIQTPAFSVAAYGTITVKIKSYVTGSSKSSTCSLIGLDKDGKAVETQSVTCSSTNMTSSYPTTTWTLTNSSNNIKKVKFVYTKATSSNMRVKEFKVIFPTTVTLDKNGGSANGSVRINHDEKAYVTSTFSAATYDASHTCTGYYTSEAGGTKVLNYDGSFAGSSVTESTTTYISSSQWAYEGETLTLYAHWESAASCSANPTIGTASLNGSFF